MEDVKITHEVLDIIKNDMNEAIQDAVNKLELRLSGEQEQYFLESLVSLSLGRIIQIGTQIGIQEGIKAYQSEKDEGIKKRYSRRLHNTKLLLREYRKLKAHATDAVFMKIIDPMEILEESDDEQVTDEMFIESIKQSKDRTAVILTHIEKMMETYKTLCEKNDGRFKEYNIRKWKALHHYYISLDEEKNIEELTELLNCGRTCIYNDLDDAARSLTTLLFGVDSLEIKRKF